MSKWEVGKRYKLRGGDEATVFMTGARGRYQIMGVIHQSESDSEASWYENGRYSDFEGDLDLMPPEPLVHRGYLNLYAESGHFHLTREEADAASSPNRIECREITWPVAEPSPC